MENQGPTINDVAQNMIESIIELKRELVRRAKLIEQLNAKISELENAIKKTSSEK